jgi:hypothetical protein
MDRHRADLRQARHLTPRRGEQSTLIAATVEAGMPPAPRRRLARAITRAVPWRRSSRMA